MSTWINWSPATRQSSFPKDFLFGDPLDLYYSEVQSESCTECGFKVEWIMSKDEFDNWNEDTRRQIRETLAQQRNYGDCPSHPKPQWV